MTLSPNETIVVCGSCREPLGPSLVTARHDDGTPRAWERTCPCGRAHFIALDGGTLDLNALPEPDLDAGGFTIYG